MKNVFRVILSGLVLLGVATTAQADMHAGKNAKMDQNRIIEKMTRKLDLNEMQVASFKEVVALMAEHHQENHGPAPLNPHQIESLLGAETFDQAQALQYVEEKITLMREHSQQMIPVVAKFTDSLNNQQRAKLNKWMQKKGHRLGSMMHGKRGKHKRYHDKQERKHKEYGYKKDYEDEN